MAVREILKMGDPRLLRVARPVELFGKEALGELIEDMFRGPTVKYNVELPDRIVRLVQINSLRMFGSVKIYSSGPTMVRALPL